MAARTASPITPDDANDLPAAVSKVYVGTGGHLKVVLVKDTNPVIFKNVPAGTILELSIKKVFATGTTAADLIALS